MLTYSGNTFCSRLKIGGKLIIEDNYITNDTTGEKSPVLQNEILIVGLTHTFYKDKTYSNRFTGIPSGCDYPPYMDSDIYPAATSCRARVRDNEDPSNLGRVRVQFDWQAQQDETMMTPWLRLAQPYAGGGKGFSFIPEIGEEVMIDFEGAMRNGHTSKAHCTMESGIRMVNGCPTRMQATRSRRSARAMATPSKSMTRARMGIFGYTTTEKRTTS